MEFPGIIWRRPLFLVFMGLIACICICYYFAGGEQAASGGSGSGQQPAQCSGRVEEIQVSASGRVLVLADVQLKNTDSEEIIPGKKILVYNASKQDLFVNSRPGNQLKITGTYAAFVRAGNPGEFDEYMYYTGKGMDGKMFAESQDVLEDHCDVLKNALFSVRQKMVQQFFSVMEEDDAGILCAMIAGEKAYLPEEEKELYQRTGIGHMLVISGVKTLSLVSPMSEKGTEIGHLFDYIVRKSTLFICAKKDDFLPFVLLGIRGDSDLRYCLAKVV